jgi:hypothetical protein
LTDECRYLELFFDCVANRDNVGILYNIAGKLKTVKLRANTSDYENFVVPEEMDGEGEDGEDEGGDEDETPEARKKRMWGAKRKRDNEVSCCVVSTRNTD